MPYYNRNHKKLKLKLNTLEYLNSGECARVLHNKDIILKEYYSETIFNYRLNEKMFDILKNISNPHFIELFDIYSCFDFIELLENKIGILPFIVDAYTAKYYSDNSVNVLLEHKDYILDNFRELEILFKIFSENMIYTDDIKRDNTVIGKDGIIIIDPDLFYTIPDLFCTMESSKELISTLNKKNLIYLFRSILINSVKNEPNYGKIITFIDNELVNFEVTDNTDVAYEISKKLKYIKQPIELFRG